MGGFESSFNGESSQREKQPIGTENMGILDEQKILQEIEDNFSEEEGYDIFETYLKNLLDIDLKKQILKLFHKNSNSILEGIINEKIVLPSEQTIDDFKKFFGLYTKEGNGKNLQEEESEVQEEESEVQEKIKSIGDDLKDYIDVPQVKTFINYLETGNYKEANIFLENYDNLKVILNALHKKNPQLFEDFSQKLIKYDAVKFTPLINRFREDLITSNTIIEGQKFTLNQARIQASLYNGTIERDGIYLKSGDITVDTSDIPPSRTIGKKYKLDSNMPVADFYPAVLKYERALQEINPKLEGVKKELHSIENQLQKSNDISEHTRDLLDSDQNIATIKHILSTNYDIDVSNINSLEDVKPDELEENQKNKLIQKQVLLKEKQKELTDDLKQIENIYKNNLNELKAEYKNTIKQQDDKVRESLQFISAIGFDNIPQSISSNIFSQVSKTSPIYLGSNVITSIDLSTFSLEGSFRPTLNLDQGVGDMNTKRLFMQLMNKMITGDETYPIDIDSYVGGTPQYKANKDDTTSSLGNNLLQTYISDKIGLNGTTPDLNIKENIGWMGDKIKNK